MFSVAAEQGGALHTQQAMSNHHAAELESGTRFSFGENWQRFLRVLNEERIRLAQQSLLAMLEMESLQGKRFVDIGSGSGLFSLAARRLGAHVESFDYDPASVACTRELRQRYFPNDPDWTVEEASILDPAHLAKLGQYSIVYSWGVLHHTGAMWEAMGNAANLVAPGGKMFIAIYNDQGYVSRRWLKVKRAYNRLPSGLRWLVVVPTLVRLWGMTTLLDIAHGRPFQTWRNYSANSTRGMTAWRDVIDWVGGLPYEVATPDAVFDFFRARGFRLERLKTCLGGHGCNEFVFTKLGVSMLEE